MYEADRDEWSVADDGFYTEETLSPANQEIYLWSWGGDFYDGNGVPGQTDEPPN